MAHNIISPDEQGFANQDDEISEPRMIDVNPSRNGSSSSSIASDSENSQKVTEELKCETEPVCHRLHANEGLAIMRQMQHACNLLHAIEEPQHGSEPDIYT